jgi:hypothetical protein
MSGPVAHTAMLLLTVAGRTYRYVPAVSHVTTLPLAADSHHYMTVISLNISHAVTCTDVINVVVVVNSCVQQANNDALSDALAIKQLLTQ